MYFLIRHRKKKIYKEDTQFSSDLSFFFYSSSKVKNILRQKPQHIYAGFDPTADSLHIGNLLVIMGLIHSQRAGHHPIALIGGATGRIGDPSGRTTERSALVTDSLNHNLECIRKQIQQVFDNHEEHFWSTRSRVGHLNKVKYVASSLRNGNEWQTFYAKKQLTLHLL